MVQSKTLAKVNLLKVVVKKGRELLRGELGKMKIVFDNDETVLEFNRFIENVAIPYYQKKFDMEVVYPDRYEIEEIFDMENVLLRRGVKKENVKKEIKKMNNQFWMSTRFFRYALFNGFKPQAAKVMRSLIQQGNTVEIHTARPLACRQDFVGRVTRILTVVPYWLHGVFIAPSDFNYYSDDDEKVQGIVETQPEVVFDDKPYIIEQCELNGIKSICVAAKHNKEVVPNKNVGIMKKYSIENVNRLFTHLLEQKQPTYYFDETATEKLY